MKQSLLGYTVDELKAVAKDLGLPAFVGKQISEWLYGKQVTSFEAMTNLSKAARERLSQTYQIGCSAPVDAQRSVDGTIKYLYQTHEGDFIETVYIPDGERATLCVSCQVGCKMGCKFCMTGRQGYVASLSVADILNQIYSLPERKNLTNIVFMGQGEPFDNYDNVLRATQVLTADWGYAWSPKRITVSTVGLKKGLVKFLEESKCSLAISLHHPIPTERKEIMPAEKACSIVELIEILKQYDFCSRRPNNPESAKQRRLTFEYIVFGGLNDKKKHADALLDLLKDLDCRVNLIRFHTIPDSPFKNTEEKNITWFRDYLNEHGLTTTIRASRGQDIFAACGLLSTKKQQEQKKATVEMSNE
ncbi:MAG: 23S rRNA (adenine(2503)-C(2))-methyltransferase RlmN [Bacteroidaceae bacterium]|nr:23S rRNA (adenine(2503)-C(2))-methyltransferase RlmN [Bacteroidaceae bacterium]